MSLRLIPAPATRRNLLLLLLVSLGTPFLSAAETTLTILHTNDLHQALAPLPRIAAYVAETRRQTPNTLFVDAGDSFDRGSSLVPLTLGETMYAAMHKMGYDMRILGNHDWAYGSERLRELMEAYPTPVLGTNLATARPPPPANLVPTLVREFDGVRIGFLGITLDAYNTDPKWQPHVYITPCRAATAKAVADLQAAKVDAIVAITHLGVRKMAFETTSTFPSDEDLAKEFPAIAVIVGGHSHTNLSPAESRQLFEQTGTVIVQSGASGAVLGRLTVVLDTTRHRAVRFEAQNVAMGPERTADPALAAFLADQYRQFMPNAQDVVGEFGGDMEFHNLAYWYADFARTQAAADIALLPRRALYDEPKSFGRGPVTVERLFGYLYDRYLVRGTVTGDELLRYCAAPDMRDRFNPFHHQAKPFTGDAVFASGLRATFQPADHSVRFDITPGKRYTVVVPWPFSPGDMSRYRHRLPPPAAVKLESVVPGLALGDPVLLPGTTRQRLLEAAKARPLDFTRPYPEPSPDWAPWTTWFEASLAR